MEKEKEYIVIVEGIGGSVLADIVTFVGLIILWYFNYAYMGNDLWIKLFIWIMMFIACSNHGNSKVHHFDSKLEAVSFLEK